MLLFQSCNPFNEKQPKIGENECFCKLPDTLSCPAFTTMPSIMDFGWWDVHSVFQKELWKCVRCFTLQNAG